MKNITSGALPTADIVDKNFGAKARLELFNHYLTHKVNSERTVLENIIISFNKKYIPERYSIITNENLKITRDSSISIQTDGLFGSKFLVIEIGGEEEQGQAADHHRAAHEGGR